MKKIHDIKLRIREELKETAEDHSTNFAGFWGLTKPAKSINLKSYSKIVMVLAVIASLFMMAFGRAYVVKADIEYSAGSAKMHLNKSIDLIKSGNYDQAFEESTKAHSEIEKIKLNLQSWGQDSEYLKMIDYKSELVGIENLVDVADKILSMADQSKGLLNNIADNYGGQQITDAKDINIKIDLAQIDHFIQNYSNQIDVLSEQVSKIKVSDSLMSEGDKNNILKSLAGLKSSLANVHDNYLPLLNWLFAERGQHKIMLVFQNNSEIRGSGGFIGSYAILTTEDSTVKRIDFQTNIYKLDTAAASKINIQAPPEYDTLAGGKFYLRDANYAVDGPESFAKVLEMYKLESGNDLDGVVAVDTSMVTDLLDLIGPINLPAYNLNIDSKNFLNQVEYEVENNYFQRDGNKQENEPKKILADMMPIFMNKLFSGLKDSSLRSGILKIISNSTSQKHLEIYSKDAVVQAEIEKLSLAGQVPSGDFDFFLSHSTNIGGGKSSLNMAEDVNDEVVIDDQGSVRHNVTLTRKHNGTGEWPDRDNINLIRILLPAQSTINSFEKIKGNFWPHMQPNRAKDPDHYSGTEAGKDKLSFWMNTKPQEVSQVKFSYASSYKVNPGNVKEYRLYIEKQAGAPVNDYHLSLKYPESWLVQSTSIHSNLEFNFKLDRDKLIDLNFK